MHKLGPEMYSPKTTEPDLGGSPSTRLFFQPLLLQDCHFRLQGTVISAHRKNEIHCMSAWEGSFAMFTLCCQQPHTNPNDLGSSEYLSLMTRSHSVSQTLSQMGDGC